MFKGRWWIALSVCCLLILVSVAPVAAHGYLVRAIPADRSVLERAPTRLQYWFSESLEPRFSQIHVRDATGAILASGGIDPTNATALMVQLPPGRLPDGAYIVELRPAFASDSHAVIESRVFFVGETSSDVAGVAASPYAQPLEIVWKTLLMLGTCLLFGVYATYALALVPAWGSAQHALGHLPPRLVTRLHHLVLIGLALTVSANMLALTQQTMTFFNVDALTALRTDMWHIVRTSSRAGDVWTLRMLLLMTLAALHGASWYFRVTWPALLRPLWTGNVWLMALIIGLQAITSHAAGALVQPWIAVFMHWTHSLAAAFWVGGIGVLVLILPTALHPYAGDERRQALLVVLRVFSRLVIGVVALVIVSGVYNALNWFYSPQDVATTYGGALALKLLMVGLLLALGGLHHLAVHPQRQAKLMTWARRWTQHVPVTLRGEALVGALVLTAAALLSATPIPQPPFVQTETNSLTQTQTVNGLTTTLSLAPGVPGINTFDVVVERADEPLTDARVALQMVLPARDQRTRWQTTEPIEPGLSVWASDAIDRVGEWTFLIDVTETEAKTTRIAFTQTIAADPILIRPLSLLQVMTLLSVIGIALWIFWPQMKASAARLNWHPASLLVAGGAIVLSGLVLWGGTLFIEAQQQRTDDLLNPPPQIVNPTLPDAASLQRGAALYNDVCRAWQTSADFEPLIRQLDVLRDEVLYRIPAQGWRQMPPCKGTLDAAQTWDVVNFLRTQRRVVEEQ